MITPIKIFIKKFQKKYLLNPLIFSSLMKGLEKLLRELRKRKETKTISRAKQRENRRKKHYDEANRSHKPWLNNEGYHDPTAYLAIWNVDKELKKNGHRGPAISQKEF